MANFANVRAHIDALENAVQQVQSEIFRLELQQYISELRVMIAEIEAKQARGTEVVVVIHALEKMAKCVYWLSQILDLFM